MMTTFPFVSPRTAKSPASLLTLPGLVLFVPFVLFSLSCLALHAAPLHAAEALEKTASSPVGVSESIDAPPQAVPPTAASPDTPPAATVPAELHELWTGSLYASSYRAGVCLGSDGQVRGVLLLRVPSGKVDVYHFRGEHGEGRISAQHSSGHTFKGQFDNEGEVSGVVKLKNGFTVKLKGQRTHNVELTETCRPLPESAAAQ